MADSKAQLKLRKLHDAYQKHAPVPYGISNVTQCIGKCRCGRVFRREYRSVYIKPGKTHPLVWHREPCEWELMARKDLAFRLRMIRRTVLHMELRGRQGGRTYEAQSNAA